MFDLSELPSGWQEHIHPDGKPYFHHAEWRVVTEANIRDSVALKTLEALYMTIKMRWLADPTYNDTVNYELYLAMTSDQQYYYFIDNDNLDIFWLEDCSTEEIGAGSYSMSYGTS